jgi:hypothetical protein
MRITILVADNQSLLLLNLEIDITEVKNCNDVK